MQNSVLIVTVTKVEAKAVLDTFSEAAGKKWTRRRIGNKTYYELGIHGDTPVFMVQSEMGIATPGGSLPTVHQAIQKLQPQAIVMCGIAFGLHPDKQSLGDILVSKQLLYYEPQKIDLQRGQMPRGDRVTASDLLLDGFRSGDNDWQGAQTHFGLVLSGEKLVNDSSFRDLLLKIEPEAIGGEMEGAGLYVATREDKVDWILVKGICDWADGNKNDSAQSLAAQNAAQFVFHVLQQGGLDNSEYRELSTTPPIITYTVFISSPGDVMEERRTAYAVIEEINRYFRKMTDLIGVRIILDALTWEKDAYPNAGSPQRIIKNQIPYERCDIFIGIFWKRFGKPTGDKRPQDGKPYLSGTQQEIEEAIAHRGKTGSPDIMLYRKDELIATPKEEEEIEQLHRVAAFFRECEQEGSNQALVYLFKSETFGEMLRGHLIMAVTDLHTKVSDRKGKQVHKSTTNSSEHQSDKSESKVSDEIKDSMSNWLEQVKLSGHPFRFLRAEIDGKLPRYFARFQQIRTLTRAEVFEDRRPWIFFGRFGFGKTALRKWFASWGNPDNPNIDILYLEFDRDSFQEILSKSKQPSNFKEHFLQSAHHRVVQWQQAHSRPSTDWQLTDDIAGSVAELSLSLRSCGISRVMCLIDPDRDNFHFQDAPISPVGLVTQLLELPPAPGIGFCYFLPTELEESFNRVLLAHSSSKYRIIHIKWRVDDLLGLISRRLIVYSSNQAAPYRSLGELCSNERDFASLADHKIANLAEESPRGVVDLANHLIELHVQEFPLHPQIAPKTWDEVEMDWYSNRRSRILGIPEHGLWIKDEQIFYGNRKLVLSETTRRLLTCLVQGQENFASKEELKQAGWPEVSQQGVSDPALREAIRRMKREIKVEFEANILGTPPSIKSVRARGYRLINTGPTAAREAKK